MNVSFSPFALNPIAQSVDRLLDEAFFGGPSRDLWSRGGGGATAVQPMPLDVYATGDEVVLLAAVPGMRPEDLEITADENTITLSGTVHSPTDAEGGQGRDVVRPRAVERPVPAQRDAAVRDRRGQGRGELRGRHRPGRASRRRSVPNRRRSRSARATAGGQSVPATRAPAERVVVAGSRPWTPLLPTP
jgi:HSP20 family molecular chaperone IbpA